MIIPNHWKTYRLVIIGGMIVCFLWFFYWMIPTSGFFRLSVFGDHFVKNGASIVFFKKGKNINAYSLRSYTMGWLVIKDTWTLILFGILLGYPLGEYVSGKAYGDYEKLLYNLSVREDKAKRMMEKAEEQFSELDRWQYTLRVLQKKLYYAENRVEEQKMEHVALRKKYKSIENDLHKARAKMRRLKSSKRNYQKPVEEEWWLE